MSHCLATKYAVSVAFKKMALVVMGEALLHGRYGLAASVTGTA
jgi:hypothetical protein